MKYQVIKLPYYTDASTEILVSKISEDNKSSVQELFINYAPLIPFEEFSSNMFVLYSKTDIRINVVGVIAFSNNSVDEKYGRKVDVEHTNYNEISLVIIDEKFTIGNKLSDCFLKILPQIVNRSDNKDEEVWLVYKDTLHGRKVEKLFKRFLEYTFQNEAGYFAKSLISINEYQKNRSLHIEEVIKNTASK